MKKYLKLLEGAFDPPPPLSDREKEEWNTTIEDEDNGETQEEFEKRMRRKELKEKRQKFNLGNSEIHFVNTLLKGSDYSVFYKLLTKYFNSIDINFGKRKNKRLKVSLIRKSYT